VALPLPPLETIMSRLHPGVDEDIAVLENRVAFVQSRQGWRFGIDAVLLARHVLAGPQPDALEIGTGVGVISILLVSWGYAGTVTAIEIQPTLSDRARSNVNANGLGDRIRVVSGDVREMDQRLPNLQFGRIFGNPPYFGAHDGRINPHPEKAAARHELSLDVESLCSVIARHLAPHGLASILYPWSKQFDLCRAASISGLSVVAQKKALPEDDRAPRVGIFDLVALGEKTVTRPA